MNNRHDIDIIIARYLSGETTASDIMELSEWLSEDEINAGLLNSVGEYWKGVSIPTNISATDKVFGNVLSHIKNNPRGKKTTVNRNKKTLMTLISVAAACFLFVGGMLLSDSVLVGESNYYFYSSGKSVSQIALPDGTAVSLNKNSMLSYSDRYGRRNRDVVLEGQAWFDVARNEKLPFSVVLGNAKAVALGTRFMADYRNGDNMIKTSLVSGSVRFESKDQSVLLRPGDQICYIPESGSISVGSFDIETETAWKDNLIRYKSMPFRDFVMLLQDNYECTVILTGSALDNIRITGSLDATQSLEQILDVIKYTIPYKWSKVGEDYLLTPTI